MQTAHRSRFTTLGKRLQPNGGLRLKTFAREETNTQCINELIMMNRAADFLQFQYFKFCQHRK